MTKDTRELRELKKQTRLLAKRDAEKAGGAGAAIGIVLGIAMLLVWPSAISVIALFCLPLICGIALYRRTMQRLTSD
jgi:hypothetical protein